MYDLHNLKPRIAATDTEVECPVAGCTVSVSRQRERFRREDNYRCPLHGIYVSPNTFQYDDAFDNLLWTASEDRALLEKAAGGQRLVRMAGECSREALAWNVFRYLDRSAALPFWLADAARSPLAGPVEDDPELIYWSYSQRLQTDWPELLRARWEFGESLHGGIEPDLIVAGERRLVFVVARLVEADHNAANKGTGPLPRLHSYHLGGQNWHRKVIDGGPDRLAIHEAKYALLRDWLLGSWLAAQTDRVFHLIVIGRAEAHTAPAHTVGAHIAPAHTAGAHIAPAEPIDAYLIQTAERRLLHLTWEGLYAWIAALPAGDADRERLLAYLRNKTIGYDTEGMLRPALCV